MFVNNLEIIINDWLYYITLHYIILYYKLMQY